MVIISTGFIMVMFKIVTFPTLLRFSLVLMSMLFILGIGFWMAVQVANHDAQFLSRKKVKVETDITANLQKGLIVRSDKQDRLSQFEIESVNKLFKDLVTKEVRKQVANISKEFLLWRLFTFFIIGIFLFIIIIIVFFHKPALKAVILYIFQGKCS